MSKINIAVQLHKGTRKLNIAPVSVGMIGPLGVSLSSARPSTVRTNTAKINYAAVVLEYILTSRIAVVEINDLIYAEIYDENNINIVARITYDGSNNGVARFAASIPLILSSTGTIVPFVLTALKSQSGMGETKTNFKKCVKEYESKGQVSFENLLAFCDSFYYEWKNVGNPEEIEFSDSLNLNLVKQAIQTGNASYFEIFQSLLIPMPEIQIAKMPMHVNNEQNSVNENDILEKCKGGAYALNVRWGEKQSAHIPKRELLNEFVPNDTFCDLVDLIYTELSEVCERLRQGFHGIDAIGDNYVNIFMTGKPGTGKTTIAYALGAALNLPVYTVTLSKNTEESVAEGMTKVCDGGFRFVETPLLTAYKNGGIIILEEINLPDQAVMMGALGQALEKPFIIYEDGYKEVRRHPLCIPIATMNVGTQGAKEPNEALTSRFPHTYDIDDPNEETFLSVYHEKGGFDLMDCKRVYHAYEKIIAYLTSSSVNADDVAMSLTLRHCKAALLKMKRGRGFKESLKTTMIGAISIKDRSLAEQTYKSVIEPLAN